MIPKNINILGLNYIVQEVEVVSKDVLLYGEINFQTQIIRIDKSLSEERKSQVFMHELLHGVFEVIGLKELNEDEKTVQSIASALHHVFTTQPIFS